MENQINETQENQNEEHETTGLVEERLTVEIPTEIQAGAVPPCRYALA